MDGQHENIPSGGKNIMIYDNYKNDFEIPVCLLNSQLLQTT